MKFRTTKDELMRSVIFKQINDLYGMSDCELHGFHLYLIGSDVLESGLILIRIKDHEDIARTH